MVSNNKKKRKNNRNSKRNSIKKGNEKTNAAQHEEQDDNEIKAHGDTENNTVKRPYAESDSDVEGEPRKKKKKKPLLPATDKKGKKSIRQMKREKFLQREAEAQAVAKDQLKLQCLNYLSQWKNDRDNWKFMKAKQAWLYKNKFSLHLVPDSSWPVLIEYFESAKGNIRNMLLDDANKIIKQMDDWTESQNKEQGEENKEEDSPPDMEKPDETCYKRARDLIQCLEE